MMRRASLSLIYEGRDISKDIGPDLCSFTFTDKADGEADDAQVVISDRNKLWQGPWLPSHGHTMRPTIVCENWFTDGDRLSLPCGTFQVDEVELEAGETDKITVKGIPSAVKSSITGQKKTRGWQGTSLEQVAKDVAGNAGLGVVYRGEAVALGRVDQRQESDLAFLHRVANEHGCQLKVADDKIILFSGKQADTLAPLSLTRTDGGSFRAKRSTAGVYQGSRVGYTDPATGKTHKVEYKPEEAPKTGKYLELNQRVESLQQAHHVAPAALRSKNKKERTAEWSGMGDPRMRAGMTVNVSGFGKFDGTYTVKEATHTVTPESYTTRLNLEAALGY